MSEFQNVFCRHYGGGMEIIMKEIYVDNAATTRTSKAAIDAMIPYLDTIYGNPSSLHSVGQRAAEALAEARAIAAECLGAAEAREIVFTSGGSEADNQALRTIARLGKKKGKKHIISTAFEHHAVLHTLKALEKEGFEITLLDVHKNGLVTAEEVAAAIRPDTCGVSIMYANNEIGTVQPIREIGAVCREKGILFHTDAVQAVGHLPVHVQNDNIDMLSLSAHKFGGPKGVGILYAKKGVLLETLIHGGAQERGKRAGTENIASIMGMVTALRESIAHMDEYAEKLTRMRDRLIDGIASSIPHSELNGDRTHRLPGNVSFCFEGIEGEALLLLLDMHGVCASSGSACTSGSLDPSHVLLAIGRPHEIAHGSLRLSLSHENTDEEIDTILRVLPEVVATLRGMSPVWRDLQNGKRQFII